MVKISAVISAYNEEKYIEKALSSLSFVDEIVVVDNCSEDKTVNIAAKYTDKIFTQKNNPKEIDIQKNFGFEKATGEWILSIDADEEVSPELAKEIRQILDGGSSFLGEKDNLQRSKSKDLKPNVNGYWIPRKNYMFGKWIEHNTGWYPDYQLRLFRKGKGKYESKKVHEDLSLEGETEKLREHIIHHNYDSISQFVGKTMIYAPNEAKDMLSKGYEFAFFDAIRFPLKDFLSWFFARKGYKDGFHGLILSILMAFYHFLVFAFIWEKKGFKEYEKNDFLIEAEKEFKKSGRELAYWIAKEKIENIKNPIKKTLGKISNKIHGL